MSQDPWLPTLDSNVCTGCGDCIPACPTGALARIAEKAVLARPDLCSYCAGCEAVCPAGAIALPYQIVVERAG